MGFKKDMNWEWDYEDWKWDFEENWTWKWD